jgi:hypothetical protein
MILQAGTFLFSQLIDIHKQAGVTKLSFLTPELFNIVVLVVVSVGIIFAGIRLYRDFKSGPRWPEAPTNINAQTLNATSDTNRSELK